jgi:hypothetical protein
MVSRSVTGPLPYVVVVPPIVATIASQQEPPNKEDPPDVVYLSMDTVLS